MLVHDTREESERWPARAGIAGDIPSIGRHGLGGVVQIEVVREVVLRSHGFGVLVGDVDSGSRHFMR